MIQFELLKFLCGTFFCIWTINCQFTVIFDGLQRLTKGVSFAIAFLMNTDCCILCRLTCVFRQMICLLGIKPLLYLFNRVGQVFVIKRFILFSEFDFLFLILAIELKHVLIECGRFWLKHIYRVVTSHAVASAFWCCIIFHLRFVQSDQIDSALKFIVWISLDVFGMFRGFFEFLLKTMNILLTLPNYISLDITFSSTSIRWFKILIAHRLIGLLIR